MDKKQPWLAAVEALAIEISEMLPAGVVVTISVGTVLIKDERKS